MLDIVTGALDWSESVRSRFDGESGREMWSLVTYLPKINIARGREFCKEGYV